MRLRARFTPHDFAPFYEHHTTSVLRYFAKNTRDGQVAFDLMAGTFARAFEKRTSFRGSRDDQAAAWLWTIVHNELSRYQRTRSVELAALARLGLERPAPSDHELREVERLIAVEGLQEHMPDALDGLSPDQREVIRLRFYEDLSTEEIAMKLELSNEAVRARISRAFRVLRTNEQLQSAIETLDT